MRPAPASAALFSSFPRPAAGRSVHERPSRPDLMERESRSFPDYSQTSAPRRAPPCGHRHWRARRAHSSANLRRIRRGHLHHSLVQRCAEEHRGAIASVVDIVQHKAEIAGLIEGLRQLRVRLNQLEMGRKFPRAETRLMKTLTL